MNNHKGILALALVFVAPDATLGFLIHRQAPAPSSRFDGNNPFRDLDVDIDLAEDCASNFGKYSFEEIKQCRDGKSCYGRDKKTDRRIVSERKHV